MNANADTSGCRDTVVETQKGYLKRVFVTDPYFMQLQFPLLFPRGDDGYHTEIKLQNINKRRPPPVDDDDIGDERKIRECVSMKEYYSSKLMIRRNEGNNIFISLLNLMFSLMVSHIIILK